MPKRCDWVNLENPLYVQYHDDEWGQPTHEEHALFELVVLEGFQAGLSWETILNKRARFREVFADFDPEKVARFSEARCQKLLQDAGIIRNRAKIAASVTNAQAFLKVQEEFGSFDSYIWGFVDGSPERNAFDTLKDYPAQTELSQAFSKDMKRRGFRFFGPTIAYAFMQSTGMVNDHMHGCFKG